MPKSLKVGVYRLRRDGTGDPPRSLIDVARAIRARQNEQRAVSVAEDPIRPRNNLQITDQYCLLDFSRIPQVERLPLSDLRGDESDMVFGPNDKRPREQTAVLLDHHSNIIYVHEHMRGISHAAVAKYFATVGGIEKLPVEVAIHMDGLLRLQGKTPNAFRIRLSGIDDATGLGREGYGDDAVAELLRKFKAPSATIRLGLEEDQPAAIDSLIEVATALLTWNGRFGRKKPVKELSIRAEDENDSAELVSLIKDRIVHYEEIESAYGCRALQSSHERLEKVQPQSQGAVFRRQR